MDSVHDEKYELKKSICLLKDKLSDYINQLFADSNPIAVNAFKAYLEEKTQKSPNQIISDAYTEMQFLINSMEILENLTQYTQIQNPYDNSDKLICSLIKELTDEELLPKADKNEINNITEQLEKKGISATWLISHGLGSEKEIAKYLKPTNTEDIEYHKVKAGIKIDSLKVGVGGDIVIPDFIDGLPVVKIGYKAFSKKSISSVILPHYLTEIGEYAFSKSSIVSITIPDSVKKIGDGAFSDCEKLQSVILPKNLVKIEFATFDGCSSLSSIRIPANVVSINMLAFYNCKKLKKIQIPNSVKIIDNVPYLSKPTIFCDNDSYAAQYAEEFYPHKPYELYDEEE